MAETAETKENDYNTLSGLPNQSHGEYLVKFLRNRGYGLPSFC